MDNMDNLKIGDVEATILSVLSTVTRKDVGSMSMETPLTELGLKSIQIISVSALLESKLGDAPNFRALIKMKTIGDIRDYICG